MDDLAKYNQYIDLEWWRGISKRTIKSWIGNFKNEETALEILDKIIFYNKAQMHKYTECLIDQLKNRIFLKELEEGGLRYVEDSLLNKRWREYLSITKIVPAKRKTEVVCSADQVIGYWRSELGEDILSDISDIAVHLRSGIRRILLVDDFAGTGKQMSEVLSQPLIIDEREVCLGDIPKHYPEVEIVVICYVIHEEAYRKLTKDYPEVEILFVDRIGTEMSYLCSNSHLYDEKPKEEAEKLKQEIEKLQERLHQEEKYGNIKEYSLNIPIVFEHGCPNNALLLLFAKTDTWHQLFRRGEEK